MWWNALMKRLGRTFKRSTPMENITEDLRAAQRRLNELQVEYDSCVARITAGSASPEDYQRRAKLAVPLGAAREAVAAADSRARRAASASREAAFLERKDELMRRIGTTVPQLLLDLAALRLLVTEAHGVSFTNSTGSISDQFGVPSGFADEVSRAIEAASYCRSSHRRVVWDFGATGPGGKSVSDPPRFGAVPQVRLRDPFHETKLPPGASGIVNTVTGTVHVGGHR
jgi:hypothetical protein